ncbi:hypothetical protein CTA1_10177 [Colletotrichum tanaceti]|uniref:Uncharacterized protein n=1 Tax=Colletotrichum tanaceti TaxID=1306861 RepID=A0A4U6X111_9PEZI|nr:hypothetical protein CTA1_10177 [Colletotrichum tanaceti]
MVECFNASPNPSIPPSLSESSLSASHPTPQSIDRHGATAIGLWTLDSKDSRIPPPPSPVPRVSH